LLDCIGQTAAAIDRAESEPRRLRQVPDLNRQPVLTPEDDENLE
jgi:hypothetical protein